MAEPKGESLDITRRSWRQGAEGSIRDIYDALVELITNADDRYAYLEAKQGRIEIEVERRRKGMPSIVRVRDFADGMTIDVMKSKLKRVGDRVSGMAQGKDVRGTHSRGAKDVAILGGVTFESIACDGQYHKCEITPQGRFYAHPSAPRDENLYAQQLKIPAGTGTVVTLSVDPSKTQIPQHDTLRENLAQLVVLRDILACPEREVILHDVNRGRSDPLQAPTIDGHQRHSERLDIPGYPGVTAKLVIKRANKLLDDQRPRFRTGGILVKSRHAIHEATLFAADLENDAHARWFYGRLTCEYIDDLGNQFDERFERDLPATPENPCWILDSSRKQGLSRHHPFVDALFKEATKRLRPLVDEERRQAESRQAKIESDDTRRRLRALEKAAAKFMSENWQDDEAGRGADDAVPDSTFGNKGFSLSPPFAQVVVGHSVRFWLNVKQEVFPGLSVGDTVEIFCATDEISATKRFDPLEAHPNQEGVLRSIWLVKGEKVTKATAVKAQVGPVVGESTVEVMESERDRYAHIKEFCFSQKRYAVHLGSRKSVILYAPCPTVVSSPTTVELACSDAGFKLTGTRILVPRPEVGVAICKLALTAGEPGHTGVLRATISGHACECEVLSEDPAGSAITIKLEDVESGNQRYTWRPGNVLQIAARHPSLRRYLGEASKRFPGQEEERFRVLVAEIVAEAVCAKLIESRERERPEDFTEVDWNLYYAEYSKLMTKFLPIAHETQVKI